MLGFALQRHARSAMWRRTIWRITLIAVATLVICESAGLGHTFAGWARRQFVSAPESPRAVVAEPPIFLPVLPPIAFAPAREVAVLVVPQVATPLSEDNSTWWPGLLWLCGIAIVLVRVALSHAWLALLWRRDAVRDGSLLERVRLLARRLGVHRRIRVVEGPRLSGPMTFGMFRPVIALPSGFARNFNPAQQEAMLAHELAHVTARDPLWSAFADGVCALLWWQPLAWWARRQFRAASEDAADEASLLLENGPEVLAECLVKLGGRLACRQSLAKLGIEGDEYRSGLDRRVKRLLGLSGRP
jgi:Zn-dependent protease with chaperone function